MKEFLDHLGTYKTPRINEINMDKLLINCLAKFQSSTVAILLGTEAKTRCNFPNTSWERCVSFGMIFTGAFLTPPWNMAVFGRTEGYLASQNSMFSHNDLPVFSWTMIFRVLWGMACFTTWSYQLFLQKLKFTHFKWFVFFQVEIMRHSQICPCCLKTSFKGGFMSFLNRCHIPLFPISIRLSIGFYSHFLLGGLVFGW